MKSDGSKYKYMDEEVVDVKVEEAVVGAGTRSPGIAQDFPYEHEPLVVPAVYTPDHSPGRVPRELPHDLA